MLAIGQGAQDSITGTISGIGTNLLFDLSGNQQNNVRNVRQSMCRRSATRPGAARASVLPLCRAPTRGLRRRRADHPPRWPRDARIFYRA